MKKTAEDIQEWYAKELNKQVDEFDDYDLHICRVVLKYASQSAPSKERIYYVMNPDNEAWEQLSIGFETLEEAIKFKNGCVLRYPYSRIFAELSSPNPDQGKEIIYDIEFGSDCKAGISVKNNVLHVIEAMNGHGDEIKDVKITVADSPASQKQQ